ncbi:MAG: hypothetical protein IKO55_17140, partial [Kiritimatiellae bacterium]|nr:hypothetical protein [Kiritimatiellia bacterium]
ISIRGIVRDAFKDEIDPNWNYLVLNSDSHIIYAAFFDNGISDDKLTMLIDAEVSVSGACMPSNAGKRIFLGRHIHALSCSSVKVLVPAPADPFTAPILTYMRNAQPESVLHMKRRRAIGSVVAAWGSNQFLLETEKRQILRVELAHGKRLPAYGDGVEVVGVPDTDLYHINLSRAIYRPAKVSIRKRRTHSVTPADILKAPNGQTRIKAEFYGWTICMKGIIRHIPSPESGSGRMNIECGDFLVPIEASGCPECMNGLSVGMEIEVTGACLFDTENWRQAVFPRIKEFLIVVRKPDDVKILTRPPWWTMGRLLALVGTLLVIMSGIIIWNRALNRIVERRSRALLKERAAHDNANLKKEERTRLAVELHDTLAQNLTGVSLQIDAAQMAAEANPDSVLPYLESARRKMQNCRENLRNCLWDLRSRAFEERSLDEAIRKTIAPHVENADIQIDLPVPCRRLSDNAIHAVLCIVRELILNAIRYGKASSIKISGKLEKSGLSFTVADNGTGFDPATRLSIPEGHFGLQGILERTHRLGGTFEIT